MSEQLGHYRVQQAIGAGSFATVHLAVDDRLDDTVAIKVLAENHCLNPEIRQRFIAEGRSLRRVGGPHVVSVYDMGETERMQPYLVLEHADQGSVRSRVEHLRSQGWRARTEDLLVFARALATAVASVHEARMVHRDLSPGNLLLSSRTGAEPHARVRRSGYGEPEPASAVVQPGERLLIADLGMCKDLALSTGLTVAGGTEGFRPPEQDGPGRVDIRADVWAMSALLEWLGGDAVPPALRKVIRRGKSDKPRRRQPDAWVWWEEVEAALAPPPASPEAGPGSADRPGPAPHVGEHPGAGAGEGVQGAASADSTGSAAGTGSAQRGTRRGRLRLRLILMASVLVAGLVGGVLLGHWAFEGTGSLPAQTAEASVAISGPVEVGVGEQAEFTADVEGASTWVWTLPDNRHVVDEQSATVTATSTGTGEVVLRARAPDGQELEIRHVFSVTE